MTEPTKGERTRQKLVAATGVLLRRQGFHATGLSDIVAESGAPRGSLYFYFPGGKDELAMAAIEDAGNDWRTRITTAVAAAPDVASAIAEVIDLLARDLEDSKFQNGCPVAGVALESPSESVRKAIAAHYRMLETGVAEHLVANGMSEPVAKQFAVVAISSIEGALILARVQKSTAPLQTVGDALRMMATAMQPVRGKRRT